MPLTSISFQMVYLVRSQNEGQDISMDARTGLSPEIGNVANANDGNGVERGSRAPSSLDHFVHRDDMIGLARDLG